MALSMSFSRWIYQAAPNSLKIMLQEKKIEGMKNNCDNISTAELYTPLLQSKGHVYKVKVKWTQMTIVKRSS